MSDSQNGLVAPQQHPVASDFIALDGAGTSWRRVIFARQEQPGLTMRPDVRAAAAVAHEAAIAATGPATRGAASRGSKP